MVNTPVLCHGEDGVADFLTAMQAEREDICEVLHNQADMIMTKDEQIVFDNATHCYECDERFDWLGVGTVNKVRDQCHISEKKRKNLSIIS